MLTLLNYADRHFRTSQQKNSKTGLLVGGFDRVISFGPQDIEQEFRRNNNAILELPLGNGCWLWKPYFILQTLQKLPDGEWLFYCDSGSYWVSSVKPLIDLAMANDENLLTFEDDHLESKHSKRDAFVLLEADIPSISGTLQRLGGFSLWRNTSFTREFANSWLTACKDSRILIDSPNTQGLPNYPDFVANRHDQTAFSILTKKFDAPAYRDPSQWGNDRLAKYSNSPYSQLIELTRQRDVSLMVKLKQEVKRIIRPPVL